MEYTEDKEVFFSVMEMAFDLLQDSERGELRFKLWDDYLQYCEDNNWIPIEKPSDLNSKEHYIVYFCNQYTGKGRFYKITASLLD